MTTYAMGPGGPVGPGHDLLVVDQPFTNHNGGNLVFGPDGLLWIGLGDGGSGGDPNNNAQNPGTPLGKMIRMNVANGQWSIWASGLRNPWRFSFDRATAISGSATSARTPGRRSTSLPACSRLASTTARRFEGTHVYNANRSVPNAVPPVYEYPHGGGVCAVTGGYVYRGTRNANMNGVYLFADFCIGHVMGFAGGQVRDLGMVASNLSSFGQDLNGDLYVLSLDGPVFRVDPG